MGIGMFSRKKAQKKVSQNIIQFLLDINSSQLICSSNDEGRKSFQ